MDEVEILSGGKVGGRAQDEDDISSGSGDDMDDDNI